MALPKQVQAQIAEIEEYEKALEAQQEPQAEELDTEAEVVATIEAAPKPEEAKPADTSPTDVEDDFKQKYSTLRGKYDAEVPRLHQQVREMTEELTAIRKEMTAKKDEPTKPKEKVSYVTDEDRAEFGEELIEVQRRVAKEVSQDYEERFEQQNEVIAQLQNQLKQTGNQVGEMSFAQRLSQMVPDFAEIDQDERWIAWLNEHDPMLRGPRRDQAAQAFNTGDADAVAHYVKLWRQTLEPEVPQERQTRQAELEKQVAPNRSANSANTKSVGKDVKVYSEREIAAAWNRIRNLNTRHQYDEATKLEAEITAAYLEGRVR